MKIRRKTWYWGKFVYATELPTGIDAPDYELYDEAKHGWHHSEEAKQAACPDCKSHDWCCGQPCGKDHS